MQPMVCIFAALAGGILLAEAPAGTFCPWPLPLWLWPSALGLGWLILACSWRWRPAWRLPAVVVITVLAGAWLARQQSVLEGPEAICNAAGGPWQVVVAGPVGRWLDVQGRLRQQVEVRLLAEQCGGLWQPRRGRVALRLRVGPTVARGDRLQLHLRLQPWGPRQYLDALAPADWGRRRQLSGRAQVQSLHLPLGVGGGPLAHLDRLRHRAAAGFERALPPSTAALAKALALGDRAAVSDVQRQAWADAGIAHLLAISGLHVGLLGAACFWLLRALLGRWPGLLERGRVTAWAAAACLPGLIAYCALTGAAASSLRATCMLVAAYLGILLGQRGGIGNAWGLAGVLLLAAQPLLLFEPGFLLSFAAVAALVGWRWPAPAAGPGSRLRRAAGLALWTATVSSLATLPLTAIFFQRAALLAPLVNLLAVPIGTLLATPLAILGAGLANTYPPALPWLAVPLDAVLRGLDALAHEVATWPLAAIDVAPPGPLQAGAYLALLLALVSWQHRRGGYRLLCLVASLGLLVGALALPVRLPRHLRGCLLVEHLPVGQGDSTLITGPQGGSMLVDGGGAVLPDDPDPGRRVVAPHLRRRGIRRLDLVVVTHAHPDHLGGLLYIADNWPIVQLWHNGQGLETAGMQRLLRAVRRRGGRVQQVDASRPPELWQGVRLQVLHPPPATAGRLVPTRGDLNHGSLLLRLEHGQRSLLLAADLEAAAEADLGPQMRAVDVLKLGHHGSRRASQAAWLARLQPALAVLSCGAGNRYGFPHAEVLARLRAQAVPLWRTDEQGLLRLWSDGHRWEGQDAQGGRWLLPTSHGKLNP